MALYLCTKECATILPFSWFTSLTHWKNVRGQLIMERNSQWGVLGRDAVKIALIYPFFSMILHAMEVAGEGWMLSFLPRTMTFCVKAIQHHSCYCLCCLWICHVACKYQPSKGNSCVWASCFKLEVCWNLWVGMIYAHFRARLR